MVFSPSDATPVYEPDQEVLVNNARSAAMARDLLVAAIRAEIAGTTTREQRIMLRVARVNSARNRKLQGTSSRA